MTDSQSPRPYRHNGFTLAEILVVLILVGILSATAITILPDSDTNLAEEASRLSSHLRYTQIRAQADIHEWRLVFTSATTYKLGPVVLTGSGFTPSNIPGTSSTEGTLTGGVSTATGTVIRFDSWGRPMNDLGTLLTSNTSITLTKGERNETITIHGETGLIP